MTVVDGAGRGFKSLQMTTALLLHFIQCPPALSLEDRQDDLLSAIQQSLDQKVPRLLRAPCMPPSPLVLTHAPPLQEQSEARKNNCQKFVQSVHESYNASYRLSTKFVMHLFNSLGDPSAMASEKSAGALSKPLKERVIHLLEDLLSVLNLPEWPAAETIVLSFVTFCKARVDGESFSILFSHVRAVLLGLALLAFRRFGL